MYWYFYKSWQSLVHCRLEKEDHDLCAPDNSTVLHPPLYPHHTHHTPHHTIPSPTSIPATQNAPDNSPVCQSRRCWASNVTRNAKKCKLSKHNFLRHCLITNYQKIKGKFWWRNQDKIYPIDAKISRGFNFLGQILLVFVHFPFQITVEGRKRRVDI